MICMLVMHGHNEHDVLWRYSVDKVNRYYQAVVKIVDVTRYNTAVMHYMANYTTQIAQSREHAKRMRSAWEKYIDSMDPESKDKSKVTKKSMKKLGNIREIPVVKKKE